MSPDYAALTQTRRPYVGQLTADTQAAQPIIPPELLHLAPDALAAVCNAAAALPVPELRVPAPPRLPGAHRADTDRTRPQVGPDYWPWTEQEREAIRWQLRRSLLDNADTGLIPAIPAEATR